MTRDRTGDLLEHQAAETHKAQIRQLLCPGAGHCNWDHEHAEPLADEVEDPA